MAGMGGRKATRAQRLPQRTPDFPVELAGVDPFMRVSLMKAARAGVGGALFRNPDTFDVLAKARTLQCLEHENASKDSAQKGGALRLYLMTGESAIEVNPSRKHRNMSAR